VWVGTEDEAFVIGHMSMHQKNQERSTRPEDALSMLGDNTNAMGMREYVVVHGMRE
jgi:hypothetical protein